MCALGKRSVQPESRSADSVKTSREIVRIAPHNRMARGPHRGAALAVLLLALSVDLATAQLKSLEVLLLDSPPFTCTDTVCAELCLLQRLGTNSIY